MHNLAPHTILFLLNESDWKVAELDQDGLKRDGFTAGKRKSLSLKEAVFTERERIWYLLLMSWDFSIKTDFFKLDIVISEIVKAHTA